MDVEIMAWVVWPSTKGSDLGIYTGRMSLWSNYTSCGFSCINKFHERKRREGE